MSACTIPPAGWFCTRQSGHAGPCAAAPLPAAPTLEDAFRAGFAAAEEALGAHGSEHLLDSIERAWTDYADDNTLSPALDNTAVEGQEAISDAVHSALWDADAENKRLREALQPFANAANRLTHYGDIDDRYEGTGHRLFASRTGSHLLELLDGVDGDPLTIGHLTEARAALTAETEKA